MAQQQQHLAQEVEVVGPLALVLQHPVAQGESRLFGEGESLRTMRHGASTSGEI